MVPSSSNSQLFQPVTRQTATEFFQHLQQGNISSVLQGNSIKPLYQGLNYQHIEAETLKRLNGLSTSLASHPHRPVVLQNQVESIFRSVETQARFDTAYASLPPQKVDVAVVGNDLESVIAAIKASNHGKNKVVLLRREGEDINLGGLLVNANQTSLDRDFKNTTNDPSLYLELIKEAGANPKDVSINPQQLESVLWKHLRDNNIQVVNGDADLALKMTPNAKQIDVLGIEDSQRGKLVFKPTTVIDTSADGEVFKKVGSWNYGNLQTLDALGSELQNATNNAGALAISPIPTVQIDYTHLDTLDQAIRRTGVSFRHLTIPPEVQAFLKELPQDASAPLKSSRNSGLVGSAIGTDFIRWMYEHHPQQATALQLGNTDGARTLVGAFNLSQPNNNQMGLNFNGFAWIPSNLSEIDTLRETKQAPHDMQQLIQLFGDYLSQKTNTSVTTTLPKELYIRDFGRQFATSNDITYQDAFHSNITPTTFASFNYANDYRGQYPTDVMKGMSNAGQPNWDVVKPTLQLSTDQGIHQEVHNLLGVSQSIGSTPGADGAFRIQQNLSYLSEMLGLRTQLALERGVPVSQISAQDVHTAMLQQGWKPYASTPMVLNSYATKAIATDNLTQQKR